MSGLLVEDAAALADWLRGQGERIRLAGLGTRTARLPPAAAGARTVSLRRLDAVVRLLPDDLTCSVQPGVRMAELQQALASRRLELGLFGGGTVGGLFAHDPLGAAVPGTPSPRSVLLGLEGVLADGTVFKSGARVVKSVAGYDVHRLFVGSRGRLFAATLLHLKLRPAPPASAAFAGAEGDLEAALPRFLALRREVPPPRRLVLAGRVPTYCLRGLLAGRPARITAVLRRHALREHGEPGPDHLDLSAAGPGREIVAGIVRPGRLPDLLPLLPAGTPVLVHAGGRFEAALQPAEADALLERLPALEAAGAVVAGEPARRGRGTPPDPGAARLEARLLAAFDPRGVLT